MNDQHRPRQPQQPAPVAIGKLLNREPPTAIEAEMSVLGALLLGPPQDVTAEVFVTLTATDFYEERHTAIYNALHTVHAKSRGALDLVQVNQMLADADQLGAIGGTQYLVQLAEGCPSSANANHFAKIVRDKARLRRMIDACSSALYACYHSDGAEVDAVTSKVLDGVTRSAKITGGSKSIRLADAEAQLIEAMGKGERDMYPTGIPVFDEAIGGLLKTGVCSCMGFPGSGKTTLMMEAAVSIASGAQGVRVPVRVFSYEQPARRIAATALTRDAGVPIHSMMNRGTYPDAEQWARIMHTIEQHEQIDFEIIEENMDAPTIFREIQACGAKVGRGVAVVDYIQNLPGFGKFTEATPKIEESMRWLQRAARECGWLVLVVSQVDKKSAKENLRPTMASGLGSGAIEQASDMILSVWRPYQGEAKAVVGDDVTWIYRQRRTELACLKNKYGAVGSAVVSFEAERMCFREPIDAERAAWDD